MKDSYLFHPYIWGGSESSDLENVLKAFLCVRVCDSVKPALFT